ncbi:UPF0348 protein [Proteiniborus sp. DW1]|uniref:nucleotidyltransferase n=1 Tax=Proteiniborus sp. DW1 TaxID=1889883 RepID=UPI00092E1226|nr:nucleotidyltransferase [Proteiniborus sp. DW1]SCG83492.1 UPF0348 protein [Proteiniborus sp. DW1]
MRIVGLITEYNPFHNGHLYHLNKSKSITNSEYSVAIMSGNFLQRGEPALVDKWTRAKMAIDNGVDLVIELPVIYACQSAEIFAFGAIKILDSLGIIDSVCFGSESGNIKELDCIAEILNNEPELFRECLKIGLSQGHSYPKAREYALTKYIESSNLFDPSTINSIVSNPNNILSIEYLKSLKKIDSSIKPYTLKRKHSNYHDKSLTGTISSATAIREQLINNTSIENIKHVVPSKTYKYLEDFYNEYRGFNYLDNYSTILLYLLRNSTSDSLKNILDVNEGLDNRIIDCSTKYSSIYDILDCINTKRYTMTRLKRIFTHLLLNLNKEIVHELVPIGPQYIRVLGANSKGIEILKMAKKSSKLPIITKFADYIKLNNALVSQMIELDKKATDIYELGLSKDKSKVNLDYTTSPYIKLAN